MSLAAHAATPDRDPRYAPARLEVEANAAGGMVLRHPGAPAGVFATTGGPLDSWAQAAPSRPWLCAGGGEGRRTLTYGEAAGRVAALAHGFAGLGLGPGRPLLILARNGIDTALATYAAMRTGALTAPKPP